MSRSIASKAMLVLAAFLASAGMAKSPPQKFTGRLDFWGEFALFPYAPPDPRAKECVSGAFPLRKHLRAQRRLKGKRVILTGRQVPYSSLVEQVGATERGWRGSQIPNYCGGDYVILATSVREAGAPERQK